MTDKFRSRLEVHSVINGQPAKQILAAASDVCVRENLNGQYYVTFSYPRLPDDKDRYDALVEENEVRFPNGVERGQHFVIKSVHEERRGLRIYKQVEAHHVAFNLGHYFLDNYIDFAAAQPPETLLSMIGNGTPYTMAVEGTFTNQDVFEFGEKRKYELLTEVRSLYNGELSFDNTNITLTTRKGGNYGVEIRYKKNLTGIVRKSQSMERITRLYGYGKNGLTIEGYGGRATKYIDSQYADPGHLFEGSVDFPEIDDQGRLLAAMQKHLATVELPKVSYEIDFVELEKVSADFRGEAIRSVGDTITVIDESMGYRFDARVTDYERYPFEPKRGRVVLANFRQLSAADYIWQATVGSKRAMVYTSENAVLKGVKYDDSITLVDGFGMRVADDQNRTMVRLGQTAPGEYGLALFNKSGVRTIWQDSATGNAYFSGTLQAAVINGSTINGGVINAGTLIGGIISGGTITGAHISTSMDAYPRAEMKASDKAFTVLRSADDYIQVNANYAGSPVINVVQGGTVRGQLSSLNNTMRVFGTNNLLLTTAGDIQLEPSTMGGRVTVPSWVRLYSTTSGGQTLQQALNEKANLSYVQGLESRIAALEAV
ncbi:phage tail spike protein [Paenibacillus sp. GCM10027627]|uniref:phage tail spike protein n=1 Tax=unclassified Paenibacillus TaxID=185978 RepID=UPI003636E791